MGSTIDGRVDCDELLEKLGEKLKVSKPLKGMTKNIQNNNRGVSGKKRRRESRIIFRMYLAILLRGCCTRQRREK